MKRDRTKRLHFAPIQGETAKAYLPAGLREELSTVVYYRADPSDSGGDERVVRSEAILCALIETGSWWRWPARLARWIPRRWRDAMYRWVAGNRHRFFPKGSCPLPAADTREQLLP
jgi:predicted DCC family thiol-disulfide oxidoreductase YuxK